MLARFLRAATTTPQVAASPLALRPLVAACGAALPSRAASTAGVAAAPMPPLSELLPVRAAKPARKQPRAPVPASGPKVRSCLLCVDCRRCLVAASEKSSAPPMPASRLRCSAGLTVRTCGSSSVRCQ